MLWGISWINVQLMIADAPRYIGKRDDDKTEFDENGMPKGGKVVHRTLKTKEDIKNYIKGII